MKIAYIAHPIGGDVKGNIDKILQIIRHINLTEPDVVPFAPYIPDCLIMDDGHPEERKRGIANDIALIKAGFISECRLYGPRISPGMQAEKELFESLGVPVRDMTSQHKNCDLCGEDFYHEPTDVPVVDENYNAQEGLVACGCHTGAI